MEGGRRITVSPRPCCGRRVVAKKRPGRGGTVDGFVNSVKKLQRREISSKRDRAFNMTDAQERFHNIRLQVLMNSARCQEKELLLEGIMRLEDLPSYKLPSW